MPNQSTEDYIKGIYKLQRKGRKVLTSDLARHLGIGDGSVTGMVKKLSSRRLIQYTPYRGVSLTEAGKKLALQMVRRHRLWEMFLVKFLGYRWDEIHDEAERLEHVTSAEMEHRLDKALGHPKVDPHGDPIPSSLGEFEGIDAASLSEFGEGDVVTIVRVSDEEPDILQHVAKLGITLNRRITVRKKQTFDGSLKVRVGSRERFISQRVANAIFAKPA